MRFVGVVVTLISTSSSPKENKKLVNIRYEEKITSSDIQGFHTVNEEIYGLKKWKLLWINLWFSKKYEQTICQVIYFLFLVVRRKAQTGCQVIKCGLKLLVKLQETQRDTTDGAFLYVCHLEIMFWTLHCVIVMKHIGFNIG